MSEDVAERYRALRHAIDEEARKHGRDPKSVTLVGIGKGQPVEVVAAAIQAGLRNVGENYVQEARTKLAALPPVRKHFVGHIQTNKAKAIAAAFDLVQSVDRAAAGVALSKAAVEFGKSLPVLLQLNVSPAERFGCPPAEAPKLAEALRDQPGLRLEGVMAIGPFGADRDEISRAFELAAKTLARIGGSTLSIGMSGDWREALKAGSTMVRIGEALFGSRLRRGGTRERV
jgi:pyridoxal phosphate enzyme (YggS family)